jgi:hypothetical protein
MSAKHAAQWFAVKAENLFEWLVAGIRKLFNHSMFLFEWKTAA